MLHVRIIYFGVGMAVLRVKQPSLMFIPSVTHMCLLFLFFHLYLHLLVFSVSSFDQSDGRSSECLTVVPYGRAQHK